MVGLATMTEWRGPFRLVIAPNFRQAQLFVEESRRDYGWEPWEVKIAISEWQFRGLDLRNWEVWWLDRMWPCSTHEDVEHMERVMTYARVRGAKIRRWWT